MDLGLKDKIALITGGSRGIGRAIALALATEGCKVAICARDQEPLERALQQVRATGAGAIAEVADVRSRSEVEAVVERCAAEWGGGWISWSTMWVARLANRACSKPLTRTGWRPLT